MFSEFGSNLNEYFIIVDLPEMKNYIKNKFNDDSNIYELKVNIKLDEIEELFTNERTKVFDDENLNKIYSCSEFLFYMRNIYENKNNKLLWEDLRHLFKEEYLDIIPHKKDIELLSRLVKYAPRSINNLRGLKISEQIKIVNKILESYKDDPIIGISILENHKINSDIVLDDQTKLILELTVRKDIVNDTNGKVRKILE